MNTLALVRIGSVDNVPSAVDKWTRINDTSSDPSSVKQSNTANLSKFDYYQNSYMEIFKKETIMKFSITNNYRKYDAAFYCARHHGFNQNYRHNKP